MVSGTKVCRASPSANSECIPADPPISSVTQSTVTCCDRHTIAVVLSAGCALAEEGPRLHRLHRTGQAVLSAHRRELRDTAPKMAASDLRSPRPAPRSRWRGEILRFQRSEEHTSELQSLMRISYAVFCLKKKNDIIFKHITT